MIATGLTTAEQAVFEEGLRHDHAVSTTVRILDLNHKVLGVADDGVLSGSVDVDTSQDTDRSCSVEVLDPSNRLGLVGSGPTAPVVWADKMVQIIYRVHVSALGKWVDVPIFTGPITKADDTDGKLAITGSGKEYLLNRDGGTSISKTYKKGARKTDIIGQHLAAMGETHRQITAWNARTTADMTISGVDKPWPILLSLARSLVSDSSNYPWLGYDGLGICRLASHSKAVKWHFTMGADIVSEPKVSVDESAMCNYVRVLNNDTVLATQKAPATDPFSAQNLGRGGVPRWIRSDVTTDSTDKKSAQKLADSTLDSLLRAAVDVEFESLVVPHLEPRDVIRVSAPTWEWDLQVAKYTIPLAASAAMSHGRNAQIRPTIKYKATGRAR